MSDKALTKIERRILAYLDQRGGTARRQDMVCDLSDPSSRIGRGYVNGSGGQLAMIFGKWSKRLEAQGLIKTIHYHDGFYLHHEITPQGRAELRAPTPNGEDHE